MILLADNDLILKLGACSLLDVFPAACGVSRDDVMILPTAKYVLRSAQHRSNKVAQFGADGLRRALALAEGSRVVERQYEDKEFVLLQEIERIDAGEAILFATAHAMPDSIVATGDKRALLALASAVRAKRIVDRLQGRVLCFEQAILRCMEQVGFPELRSRIFPAVNCDSVLRVAFGSGLLTTKANAIKTLSAYIKDLRSRTGALLTPDDKEKGLQP